MYTFQLTFCLPLLLYTKLDLYLPFCFLLLIVVFFFSFLYLFTVIQTHTGKTFFNVTLSDTAALVMVHIFRKCTRIQ